jgi:hypothetical protein
MLNKNEICLIIELSNILCDKEFDVAKRDGGYHLFRGANMNGNILYLYQKNKMTDEIILSENILNNKFIGKIYCIEKRDNDMYFVLNKYIGGDEIGIIYSYDTIINTNGFMIIKKLDGHLNNSNIYYYRTFIK